VTDPAVVAHPVQHRVDVRSHRLAERGDLVDERQLGRQEGVGDVLDRLGRRRVGEHDGGGHPAVQRGDPLGGTGRVRPDHDPVRIQEVVQRRPLTEEFRVGRHRHIRAVQPMADQTGGADRHRRLDDHDRSGVEIRGHLLDRGLQVGQVGRSVRTGRGGHAHDDEFTAGHTLGGAVNETQAPGREHLVHDLIEPAFVDGDAPFGEPVHLVGVHVGAHHPMSQPGQGRPGDQTDIAHPDHRDLDGSVLCLGVHAPSPTSARTSHRGGSPRTEPSGCRLPSTLPADIARE